MLAYGRGVARLQIIEGVKSLLFAYGELMAALVQSGDFDQLESVNPARFRPIRENPSTLRRTARSPEASNSSSLSAG